MSSVGELVVSIIGDVGQLKMAFSEVGKEVNQLGSKMQNAGKQMTSAGASLTKNVTAPLLAIGGSAVYAANEMDKAYKSIRVGTGATGEALEALSSDFRSVLGKVPASVEDVGTAIADLNTRLGLTGEPLQLMSKQMLELSRITGEDLSSAIESTTRVFGDWGIAVSDQADSLDHLFKVSQTTGISMGELSRNMVHYGAPLRQMGFDYETAAALIGKFNKEGVNTELVMGSLRIALGKFAREGISDANEALRIITQQVQAAGSASEANAIAIEYFGARAGPDMAASIREGRFEIDELVASLQDSSETIIKAGEDSLTFSDKLQMMKIRIFEALEPLGKQILEIFEQLEPFIYGLIGLITRLLAWFGNLPGPIKTVIIAVAGIAAAVGPLLLVIGPLVSGIGGLMTFISGAGGLSALIAGLGTTLSGVVAVVTGPIGIALAALAVAGYLIYKNWDRIGPILKDTFDNIKTAVEPVVTIIGEFVSDALVKISQWWDANGETITAGVDFLTSAAMELLSAIGDIVVFVVSILSKTVQKVLPPILALVDHVLSQILNTIVLFAQILTGDWEGAWGTLNTIVQRQMDFLSNIIPAALGPIYDIFESFGSKLYDSGKAMIQNFIDGIRSMTNPLRGTVSDVLGGVGRFFPHSPAKEGPLKVLPNWDAYFIDPLQRSVGRMSSVIPGGLENVASAIHNVTNSSTNSSTVNNTYAGDEFVIQNVNLSSDYPFERFVRDLEQYNRQKHIRRGY